ncbi:MAG: dihydrodipicolinate synthase family protein, partial [Clostridia bacterium]|nr:dihydrodipicolinate synthase family protein [Clostridia bacterium]
MSKIRNELFRGAATALITPLTRDGIDFEAMGRLIDWQIAEGIKALVICGTTGEGSTLSDAEHRDVLEYAVKRAAGRAVMIAGTGSNDTAYAIDLTRHACEIGYDGMLLVTPYYN